MSNTDPILKKRERNWAWIWLCYTGFLFLDPIFEPTLLHWAGALAVFAVFLGIFAVYIRACDRNLSLQSAMIAATFLLGLIAFPWNQGASCLFVYAAAFLPFAFESVRRVLSLMIAQMIFVLAEGYFFTVHQVPHTTFYVGWPNTLVAIFLMFVIGGGNIFFAEQKRADCKLRAAQEENLALAAVAERERIARDLHDVLGHTLSVIVLKAELAKRLLESGDTAHHRRAAAEIADVESTARTALSEVREAIGGYRAQGLAAEIESARRTLDAAGVTLLVESEHTASANLTANEETVLALALREAVTNIVRHSCATTCHLRFITQQGRRRLVIKDNGSRPNGQSPALREGNGIRGMRERVESLGGHLFLEHGTARDQGTRLLIDLPLRTEALPS